MIRYVFRRKRNKRGKVVLAKTYTGAYQLPGDPEETRIALGVTDKRVAEQMLRDVIQQVERERAGIALPKSLVESATKPLSEHLNDFVDDLRSRGRCKRYVREISYRIRGVFSTCGWVYQRDIKPDDFLTWRNTHHKSAKTLNEYLAALVGFCRWMVSVNRLTDNPLKTIGRVDARGKQTFKRRVLSVEEFNRLLAVSGKRRVLYLTAVLTSLRRGALRALLWGDVRLDETRPHLAIRASTQKDRKDRIAWLRDDVAEELRGIMPADAQPTTRVFSELLRAKGLDWFKADLAAACIPWEDSQKRRFDFHALRHTACTWAGQTGVHGAVAQQFMGHSDSRQTARYTHGDMIDTQPLIDRLPGFNSVADGLMSAQAPLTVRGTERGTESGVLASPSLSTAVAVPHREEPTKALKNKPESRGLSQIVASSHEVKNNAGDRNRTCLKEPLIGQFEGEWTVRGTVTPYTDLNQVIEAWPALPASVRASILQAVQSKASKPRAGKTSGGTPPKNGGRGGLISASCRQRDQKQSKAKPRAK